MTPTGIEPATFQLVVQFLDHCATACPHVCVCVCVCVYIYIYIYIYKNSVHTPQKVGWDDFSVGIVTFYRLDSPGIKSWWGQDFLHTSRLALEPTHPNLELRLKKE
jgi:hypothetical protein